MEMIKGFTGREGFFPKVWMSTIGLMLILGGCSGTGSSSNPQTPTINPLDRPHFTSLSPKTDESDVALNSSITIGFNKPLDPETITAASLMLLAGSETTGQPVNGNVSYSETGSNYVAVFKPSANLAPGKMYTVVITNAITSADGYKGLYASYTFTTIGKPTTDTIPPTVSSTTPANGEAAFPVNRSIVASFSEAIDSATIDSSSFYLTKNGASTNVAGNISYLAGSMTFTPSGALEASTTYTATITTAIKDLSGNNLAADYTWQFTTDVNTNIDTTPPTVSAVTPKIGATGVAINSAISASFDEALNASTVSSNSFIVSDGSANVAGAVSYSGTTATFSLPTGSTLATNTLYTVTLTTDITDLAGNALAANYVWTFITAPLTDTTPPTVTSVVPAANTIDVALNSSVSAQFSEALDPATVSNASFVLTDSAGATIPSTVSYSGTTATLTPLSALLDAVTYTATLTADITDLAGNTLSSNYAWSFTTVNVTDTTPPTVTAKIPANAATGVVTNTSISADFSEPLNAGTVNSASFLLANTTAGTNVAGTVNYSGLTATFTPSALLVAGNTYQATITTAVTDVAGNALQQNEVWSFTVAGAVDNVAPTLVALNPARLAVNVPINIATITATFSEPLDPNTITSASVVLMITANSVPVAGTVSYDSTTNGVVFTPQGNLALATQYTATVRNTVTDLAGNPLSQDIVWTFTTRNPGGMGGGGGGGL